MRYKSGVSRHQTELLPARIEDYVEADNPVRVIDAFVDALDLQDLGFTKSAPAATGCKPYSPGDLLKLYLYGYLNQTTSTRRLEKECHRNLEVRWLLGGLAPDFKTIADFRKDNSEAMKSTCRSFVLFCRQVGLVSGALVAIDGSKFKAAASREQVVTKKHLAQQINQLDQRIERYLTRLAESEQTAESVPLDTTRVSEAVAALQDERVQKIALVDELDATVKTQKCLSEPEARLMRSGREGMVVGYNAQNVVDEKHQLIISHELTQAGSDNQQLLPQLSAAQSLFDEPISAVVADAGYSNGQHVAECQAQGTEVVLPSNRAVNNQGEFYQKADFEYLPSLDAYRCPANKLLKRTTIHNAKKFVLYSRTGCRTCPKQVHCTRADKRWVTRHFYEQPMQDADELATPAMMRKRMALVEPPFGTLKRLLNGGRFRGWGLKAAASEYSLGVLSYNLMRAINVLGVKRMMALLA
jgi:transposase